MAEPWFYVSHTASFVVETTRHIAITSIHAKFLNRTEEDRYLPIDSSRFLMWSQCSTCEKYLSGDNVHANQPFLVIAALNPNADGEATASSLSWEVKGISTVSFSLTLPTESPHLAVLGKEEKNKIKGMKDGTQTCLPLAVSSPGREPTLEEKFSVTITLVGFLGGADPPSEFSWRPLMCYKWFELKPHISEVSLSLLGGGKKRRGQGDEENEVMRRGEVKEAVAISACGDYIFWKGFSFGSFVDVMPYYSIFTPARKEKCVRVRRFPHRNADIVGEIPFGVHVEAIGYETDLFTEENYVLVLLSGIEEASNLAETYGLLYVEPGKWLWGWSKIAGRNGTPLLEKVKSNVASSVHYHVEHFPDITYFTSVREDRSVRIRSSPSLKSDILGHLEPNEVKVALSIHRIPPPLKGSSPVLSQQFVEWKDGGFSLLCNNDRLYLQKVDVQVHSPLCPVQDSPAPPSSENNLLPSLGNEMDLTTTIDKS